MQAGEACEGHSLAHCQARKAHALPAQKWAEQTVDPSLDNAEHQTRQEHCQGAAPKTAECAAVTVHKLRIHSEGMPALSVACSMG